MTGATGFIGSHLAEALLRRGYEVRCLIRSTPKWLEGLPVTPVYGEIEDREALRRALRGVDLVFHVGGVTRATDWATFQHANVDQPLLLLDLIADENPDVRRVVITSSLAAVGACPGGVADEESPLHPVSDYGRSKALMEEAINRRIASGTSLPITIIRPPSVYGPREADIYTFFQTAARGVVPVVGSGHEPALTLVHVRDLVRGMIEAAGSERAVGRTYFLGTPEPVSWNEVKAATVRALGRRALTVPVPEWLVQPVGAAAEFFGKATGSYPPLNREKAREIRYACKICSSSRAEQDFGYRADTPLDAGIAETIEWYRAEGWL